MKRDVRIFVEKVRIVQDRLADAIDQIRHLKMIAGDTGVGVDVDFDAEARKCAEVFDVLQGASIDVRRAVSSRKLAFAGKCRFAVERVYFDEKGPATPWGRADAKIPIANGVAFYETPGHGGLGVSRSMARSLLSQKARQLGEFRGGTYWYEEDALIAIPLYEHPEWARAMGISESKDQLEQDIRRWNPEYFEGEAEDEPPTPRELKPGDVLEMEGLRPDKFEFVELMGRSMKVKGYYDIIYKLSVAKYEERVVKVTRNGKVIWEKG